VSALSLPSLGGPDEPTDRRFRGAQPEITWGEIAQRAPLMASTMATYLDQLSVSARPGTLAAFELALRLFAGRVTEVDSRCVSVADVERRHIEDFKLWQAQRPGRAGKKLSTTTIRHRLGLASSRTSTETRECGSMNLSPGPVDHPCNNTTGTGKPACSARYWDASLRSDWWNLGPLYSIYSSKARASR
jgi:hypothetical protein